MKTLKTRTFEAALYYMCDRGAIPHIVIDWKILNCFDGFVDVEHEEDEVSVTLNIDPNAVHNFEIVENYLHFNCRFDGLVSNCVVPTAAILAIYDKYDRVEDVTFNAFDDMQIQIAESEFLESMQEPKTFQQKKPNPFKVVK